MQTKPARAKNNSPLNYTVVTLVSIFAATSGSLATFATVLCSESQSLSHLNIFLICFRPSRRSSRKYHNRTRIMVISFGGFFSRGTHLTGEWKGGRTTGAIQSTYFVCRNAACTPALSPASSSFHSGLRGLDAPFPFFFVFLRCNLFDVFKHSAPKRNLSASVSYSIATI